MDIAGFGVRNTYQRNISEESKSNAERYGFADCLSAKIQRAQGLKDSYVPSARGGYLFCETYGNFHADNISLSSFKPIETERYTIEEKEGGFVRIYDKERNEGFNWKIGENQVQIDGASGKKFLINDLGSGFFNMVTVDAELEKGLKEALGTDELPEKELTGFTVHQDQKTGIHYITANGYESQGGLIVMDRDAVRKLDSLANEYLSEYPNIVKNYNEAWFYATFEVRGLAKRTDAGIMMIGPNSISFKGKDGKSEWTAIFDKENWQTVKEMFDKGSADTKFSEWDYWEKFFKDKEIRHFLTEPDSSYASDDYWKRHSLGMNRQSRN